MPYFTKKLSLQCLILQFLAIFNALFYKFHNFPMPYFAIFSHSQCLILQILMYANRKNVPRQTALAHFHNTNNTIIFPILQIKVYTEHETATGWVGSCICST